MLNAVRMMPINRTLSLVLLKKRATLWLQSLARIAASLSGRAFSPRLVHGRKKISNVSGLTR